MIERRPETNQQYSDDRCCSIIEQAASLRKDLLISQKSVSEMIGLSTHGNLTLIEQKKVIPRLDRMLRILSVYGYTLKVCKKEDVDI